LRKLVYAITLNLPKTQIRRISQMQDAARLVKQNIQEGYSRYSLAEYIHGLTIARGSLAELIGDVQDCREDALITSEEFAPLHELCGKTRYLLDRLLQSLRQRQKEKNWVKF